MEPETKKTFKGVWHGALLGLVLWTAIIAILFGWITLPPPEPTWTQAKAQNLLKVREARGEMAVQQMEAEKEMENGK